MAKNEEKTLPYTYGTDRCSQETMAAELKKYGRGALVSFFTIATPVKAAPEVTNFTAQTEITTVPQVGFHYGTDPAGQYALKRDLDLLQKHRERLKASAEAGKKL
jgi:hypothetical protein